MVALSLSPLAHPLSLHNKQILSLKAHHPSYYPHNRSTISLSKLTSQHHHHNHQKCHPLSSTFLGFNPLRVTVGNGRLMNQKKRESGTVCLSAPLSAREIQWVSTIATAVLMLAKGTAIQKSFLVPFFVLQAPANIISWITSEYGMWSAFLALLVRLFFFIPGELELPFMALLLVIVSPYQVMNLRGRQEGVILSLIIAAYLAFQHFIGAGGLQKAFDRGSVIATVAIICCLVLPCCLLII